MARLLAAHALLADGWAENVAIDIAPDGNIAEVAVGVTDPDAEHLLGHLVPGMIDLHSHAFQRAMAGLAQDRPAGRADFWSWRQRMYGIARRFTPEDLWAVAAALYIDLLKGGYTTVVEFHYLHGPPAGGTYDDPAVMSFALHEAAQEAGIALTLAPVWYARPGIDAAEPTPAQRRFIPSLDAYGDILDRMGRPSGTTAIVASPPPRIPCGGFLPSGWRPSRPRSTPAIPRLRSTSTSPSSRGRWRSASPPTARGRWNCSPIAWRWGRAGASFTPPT